MTTYSVSRRRVRARGLRVRPVSARPSGPAAILATLLLAGCAGGVGVAGAGDTAAAQERGTTGEEPATGSAASPIPSPIAGPVDEPADEPVPVPAPGIDLTAHSTSDPASPWVVVNKRAPLDPLDYEPELTTVRGYLVRPDAAGDLTALLEAADADGVHLTLRSAYRGYPKQAAVYEDWVAQLGRAEADAVSARPGHSEHQTGIAVDLGSSTRSSCDFEQCFGETVEGRWVAEHSAEFGFIVRYTPENHTVTGYAPEPWHVRWVGRELAAHMRATGVTTLEEVFDVPHGGYAGQRA
ncbi:M15 family metallopeptidase [Promicromonospora soli]